MSGHTTKGFPYAQGADPLTDWPATSLELANLLQKLLAPVAAQELTTSANVSSTSDASPSTIITAPSFNADGSTTYEIEFYTDQLATPAGCYCFLSLWEGSTCLLGIMATNAALAVPIDLKRRHKPAAGARVYSIRGWVSPTSNSTVYGGPGGAGQVHSPMGIRVTPVLI